MPKTARISFLLRQRGGVYVIRSLRLPGVITAPFTANVMQRYRCSQLAPCDGSVMTTYLVCNSGSPGKTQAQLSYAYRVCKGVGLLEKEISKGAVHCLATVICARRGTLQTRGQMQLAARQKQQFPVHVIGHAVGEGRITFCKETGVGHGREDVVGVRNKVALLVHNIDASQTLICTMRPRS